MTDERAIEIAKIFDDNFAMAKKMGADNTSLALAAATVYTIDDLLAARELEKIESFIKRQQERIRRSIREV